MASPPLFSHEKMDLIARRLFMPLILLVNYTLLLYLLTFYWPRRRERRVCMLFAVATLGVVCLVPFADPDDDTVSHLNDVSESCCVLTFLLQITIIGYDLNKKIKFKTVLYLTYAAELLILADLAMVLLSLTVVFERDFLTHEQQEQIPNICENLTLAFIFVFRYYYIVASRGWQDVWKNRKVEVVLYLLFATHELPFIILESATSLPWDFPQSLWNRITLAGCLSITAHSKLRDTSRHSHTTTPSAATQPRSVVTAGHSRHSATVYAISSRYRSTQRP